MADSSSESHTLDSNIQLGIISHGFPTRRNPHAHTFIKDHSKLFDNEETVSPFAIIITPYSIPFTTKWKKNHSPPLYDKSERVFYLSLPRKKFPNFIKYNLSSKLYSYVKNRQFDFLHYHWAYPAGIALPAIKKLTGLPSILTVHKIDWYENKNNPDLYPLIESAFKAADNLLITGPRLYEDIIDHIPDIDSKCKIIYNHVDLSFFTLPDKTAKLTSKETLGWDPQSFHFLNVARIHPEKGLDVMIRAMANLDDNHNFHVHTIGEVSSKAYLLELKSLLREKNIKNFHFHSPVNRERLRTYYHAADAFIQSSRVEGFSVALLEAIATGLPVIATKTGGAELIVEENESGFLIETDQIGLLAQKMQAIIENYPSFDMKSGRRLIQKKFSKEAFKDKLLTIYRENLS